MNQRKPTTSVCVYRFTPMPKGMYGHCTDACATRDRTWDRHIETTRKALAHGENLDKVKAMPGFTKTALVINRFVRSGGAITSTTHKERNMTARKTPAKTLAEKVTVINVPVPAPKAPKPTGERFVVVPVVANGAAAGSIVIQVVWDTVERKAVFATLHAVKAGKRALYCNENKAVAA